MNKLSSLFSIAVVMLFITGLTFTSCGGKKNEQATEEHMEVSEHPTDGDSTEHPSEHPAEHPTDN